VPNNNLPTLTGEIRQMLEIRLQGIEQQQADLDRRRAEVKGLLAALPTEARKTRTKPNHGSGEEKKASISSMIVEAVSNKPGASAADVVAAVTKARPEVDAKVIHAILYRLRAVDGRIRHEGERGAMTYYVAAARGKKAGEPLPRRKGTAPPYKARARRFVTTTPGQHTVSAVASAIKCTNLDQVRNILVRLNNDGFIHRVSDGVYEAYSKEAAMPGG
jgi:hypothetical protein